MKINLLFNLLFICLISCKTKKATSTNEDQVSKNFELIEVDRAFSAMSQEQGMKTAFIEYLDSNGAILKSNHMPIVGANAIDYLIQEDDSEYTLGWDPRHSEVSESGEMGYTYGIYMMHPKQQDTVYYGTYSSIWKKQIDGKWKLLLHSENEGLGK
jgi:hypothetical protein